MPKPTHSEAEAKKEYMRQWRLENAEHLREWQREYDKKRAGRVRSEEQKKRDRECNRKYMNNRWTNDPAFRERSRAPAAKRGKAWRAANLEKSREQKIASEHRRRARKAAAEDTFTPEEWQILRARSKHCHWCKTPFTAKLRPTHDHIIPFAKGGGNTLTNSCCACRPCNTRKQATLRNPITGQLILL